VSIAQLLNHRITIQRLSQTAVDGAPSFTWTTIATNVKARLDLAFARPTSDVIVAPEAGRGPDRAGTMFVQIGVDLQYGDRVIVTAPAGLAGIRLEIDGSIDPAINYASVSHFEVNVHEVAKGL